MASLPKTIYYSDELHDEFSTAQIQTKTIDENYVYIRHGLLASFLSGFVYFCIGKPIAYFYLKKEFHHKIIGKEKLKEMKGKSFFAYGNHTQIIGDAIIPKFLFGHHCNVIVHPNNVSMPILGRYTPYVGALPLPNSLSATRNFKGALETRLKENCPIVIYPEAHLWPYFTGIRPFVDDSFNYPISYKIPLYCFTNTYHARKNPSKVQIISYIDGPFYYDESLSLKEARKKLRDEVYQTMLSRSKLSDRQLIQYIRKETKND